MKITAKTFIVFLLFLIIPANAAFACGKHSKKHSTEKSCSKSDAHSKTKSCCDQKDGSRKSCEGSCGKKCCKCPTSLAFSAVFFNFNFQFQNHSGISDNVLTHRQNIPKPVYISSWRPPNIS